MTRKDNLIALRDAVVEGQRDLPKGLRSVLFGHKGSARLVTDAYNGDMNAALAFLAEVLPGWRWRVGINLAEIWLPFSDYWSFNVGHDVPARALLIAALNALITMEVA